MITVLFSLWINAIKHIGISLENLYWKIQVCEFLETFAVYDKFAILKIAQRVQGE